MVNSSLSLAGDARPHAPEVQNHPSAPIQARSRAPSNPREALFLAASEPEAEAPLKQVLGRRDTTRVPHITIHAFPERSELSEVVGSAAKDRLMAAARVAMYEGGVAAAISLYHQAPTPNLIVLETQTADPNFLSNLDKLADVCDTGTRLMVVGHVNDITFYRELIRRGVSEYALAPIDSASLISSISGIYRQNVSEPLGKIYAFVGAKGGVGSSTIAHNVAWSIGRQLASDVMLVDMDLPFGTAGLNFNVETNLGVADAIQDANRLDQLLLERLLVKCGDHLGLLSAPSMLERPHDLEPHAVQSLLEVAQSTVPFTILDMPHQWSTWSRDILVAADEIVVVATPDLASMRNTKNLVTVLTQSRPHDPPPKLILNQIGVPKRPEIKPREFSNGVQLELTGSISFDPHLFGTAANKGQMIGEISRKSDALKAFGDIAVGLTGRQEARRGGPSSSTIISVIRKIAGRR